MASSDALIEGISGSIGACLGLVATYPLNTVWSTFTTTLSSIGFVFCTRETCCSYRLGKQSGQSNRDVSTRGRNSFSELVQKNGQIAGGFYRGIYPSLVGTLTSQGLYFYFYALLRRAFLGSSRNLGDPLRGLTVGQSLVVAGVAGSANVLCTNPIWLAATRMQTNMKESTFFEEIECIYREGGLSALWRGTIPSLVMVVNPTIQYMLFEWLVQQWRRVRRKSTNLNALEIFLMSGVAKLVATLSTYPLQVVKSKIQADRSPECEEEEGREPSTVLTVFSQIWNEEGILGFFKGMRAKLLQSVLAAALMLMLKDRLYLLSMHAVSLLRRR